VVLRGAIPSLVSARYGETEQGGPIGAGKQELNDRGSHAVRRLVAGGDRRLAEERCKTRPVPGSGQPADQAAADSRSVRAVGQAGDSLFNPCRQPIGELGGEDNVGDFMT
jgi:hypothetical protein